jgi:hypothetical protein
VQRVTEKETQKTTIRDPRATNTNGTPQLVAMAESLADPIQAIEYWNGYNMDALHPLAEGYRKLVAHYEKLGSEDTVPNPINLLNELGIPFVLNQWDKQLSDLAFNALYIAERTGSDAGLRLELPIAALRVLHFVELLSDNPLPSRAMALEALYATPVISTVFSDAIPVQKVQDPVPNSTTITHQDISPRCVHLRDLAMELSATERILETVTNIPATPPIVTGGTVEMGEFLRSEFSLSTTPTVRPMIEHLSSGEVALLNQLKVTEESTVPFATQILQSHLSQLYKKAFALDDDPEFHSYMRNLNTLGEIGDFPYVPIVLDPDNKVAPDVDVSGRIIPLGIGDLKVVKKTLLAYVASEVAHVENVLKGESKERKHRKLDRTEVTLFRSDEETKDTERDTQTTDRFELKRETELTMKEDMSVKAGLTVTASYGPVVATATGDFAYSTSKLDSQKNSSNFAHDVVDRSVSKVQTKVKTERTTKTLSEVEEINTHGLDNVKGSGHVTGIYRWVDKHYRAQVYNYGIRLLVEFIVPEPAAFYRASQSNSAVKVNATPPKPFTKDCTNDKNCPNNPLTIEDITAATYQGYASRYNAAGITPPPPSTVYAGTTLVKDGLKPGASIGISTKDFVVPEGYKLKHYSAAVSLIWIGAGQFTLHVGGDRIIFKSTQDKDVGAGLKMIGDAIPGALFSPGDHFKSSGSDVFNPFGSLGPIGTENLTGSVPLSVTAYDVTAFAVNVQGEFEMQPETMIKWQIQTFDKIYAAYQTLQAVYDQKVDQAETHTGIMIQGRNPAQNRVIENVELKKLCITMMTGQHFTDFHAMTDPKPFKKEDPKTYPEVDVYDALYEGRIEQFFEQAFEWEHMTYLYYPYFWGRKKNWVDITQISDPDPLFEQFLKAGAARVVVPVPLAYYESVIYLLQRHKRALSLSEKVWRGGERPLLDDKDGLYISIAEELRNQTDDLSGAKPDPNVEPWYFTLPTTLVWLQPDATLPVFPPS